MAPPTTTATACPRFAADLARHGDRLALRTAAEALSYGELDERVADMAGRLGTARRLVLLPAANTVDAVVAYLAALRGGHPVLVTAAGQPAAIEALVDAYDPDVVVDGGDVHLRHREPAHRLHPDLAMLLSTSGSTGTPKLVRLSHENLHANAASIATYLSLRPEDRAITTLPLQYCYGLSVLTSHLHVGAGVALTDLSVVDACFWDLFRRTGATSLAGVPHTFDLLDRARFDTMDLPTLRYLTQAGGRMDPDTVRRYARLGEERGWELFVMYGQTEATARMGYLPPPLAATHPHTIGLAVPGGRFTIDTLDERGVGELVYRGPNVMLGYATQPADLALGRTVHELRTGDLARCTPEGLVEIVGRRSRFVKPFGVRVDLDDLERHLADHGTTALCTGDDALLVVAVDRATDGAAVAAAVDARLHLPPSRRRIVQLDELPRLPNGKPDHAAVRRAAEAAAASTTGIRAAPPDPVVAAFRYVLGVDADGGDSFVSLGGDSLSYVEMSIRLEELLGTLPHDWHLRPIAELIPAQPAAPARDPATTTTAARRWWARVDTSVVVRAVAIVLIVGSHARLWQQPGGAHALLAVAGYSFARFQLAGGRPWPSIARIAVPSMCWIGMVAAVSDKFTWPHAVLLNGLLSPADARWSYWFVEALVWILVPLALLFAVPAVARAERRRPFAVAVAAVAAGLVVRFDVVGELGLAYPVFRPQELFWLFALGWAAARASSTSQRLAVTATAAVAVAGFFADPTRELLVAGAVALVCWVPAVPVPRRAVPVAGAVASASLYVYLSHYQVYPPLLRNFGPAWAVLGSLTVGVVAWNIVTRLTAVARRFVPARSPAGVRSAGQRPACRGGWRGVRPACGPPTRCAWRR